MVLTKTQKTALAVAGVAAVAVVSVGVALARKAAPPTPSPGGKIQIKVKPVETAGGRGYPQAVTSVSIELTGTATAGVPAPDMTLQIIRDGVVVEEKTFPSVALNTPQTITRFDAIPGTHTVQGKMKLSNIIGTKEYETAVKTYTIGEAPAGEIVITY